MLAFIRFANSSIETNGRRPAQQKAQAQIICNYLHFRLYHTRRGFNSDKHYDEETTLNIAPFNSNGNRDGSNRDGGEGPIIHKGYTHTKFPYFRGWAYQQVFLNRRLNYKRIKKNDEDSYHQNLSGDNYDLDRILLFEHFPVYTLGRGADENNVAFLNVEGRLMLSRRTKASNKNGTSRLYVDTFKSIQTRDTNESIEYSVANEVNAMGTKDRN